jgi:hypothetical protein
MPSSKKKEPPSGATPLPPGELHVTPWLLSSQHLLHRIHQDIYKGNQFNPGNQGNARFSPIRNTKTEPIPTIYAAATFDAAAMESVFHDVSHAPGFKQFDKRKLDGQLHSTIKVESDLKLADLSSVALRKLGVQRRQLIDTDKDQYPATRRWAEVIHAQHPDIQGLSWISRQDDQARAVMLFGDRIRKGALLQVGGSLALVADDATYGHLLDLADRIGVNIVQG